MDLKFGIEGGRERWSCTPPTYNPCRYQDSKLLPLGYKSDYLTTKPLLPHI